MLTSILAWTMPVLWLVWITYWVAAARQVKAEQWRQSSAASNWHRIPIMIAVLLLVSTRHLSPFLRARFVPGTTSYVVAGTLVVALGLGFSVWARRHLGGNWSGRVTVKQGHTLVRAGPYRVVRHPIYTGLIAAFLGTAFVVGEWRGLVAFALAFLAFAIKSRVEEARMLETFPEYAPYRQSTWAIVPFVF